MADGSLAQNTRQAELRAKAELELGEDFDLRAFHDAALAEGAVPLDVLEVRIDDWIDTQQISPSAPNVLPN